MDCGRPHEREQAHWRFLLRARRKVEAIRARRERPCCRLLAALASACVALAARRALPHSPSSPTRVAAGGRISHPPALARRRARGLRARRCAYPASRRIGASGAGGNHVADRSTAPDLQVPCAPARADAAIDGSAAIACARSDRRPAHRARLARKRESRGTSVARRCAHHGARFCRAPPAHAVRGTLAANAAPAIRARSRGPRANARRFAAIRDPAFDPRRGRG